jgi:DNA-binding protein HU-beta
MMKKAELAKAIAEKVGITNVKAHECLDALAAVTSEQLAEGQEISLPGIGKLSTTARPERPGRNVKTGESITIKASTGVKFKVASSLKDAVQ